MTISNKIVELRDRLGLTQKVLAEQLGVTSSIVGYWERGHCNPSPLNLHRLKKLLVKNGVSKIDYCELGSGAFSPEQIRKIRLNANKSIQEFADLMDVDKYTVRNWELGRCHPHGKNSTKLRLLGNSTNSIEPCDDIDDLADKIANRLFDKIKRSVSFN